MAKNAPLAILIVWAWMLQSCAGQPADLKCGLLPCHVEPPETLAPNQQQAFHDCWKQRHQDLVGLSTAAREQRDYDNCLSEAKAAPSATPSPGHP
jgi:hypothetical protein